MTLARPNKNTGRVVLGPRVNGTATLRIVPCADGSGQIQIYDADSGVWQNAPELWTFSDVWNARVTVGAK